MPTPDSLDLSRVAADIGWVGWDMSRVALDMDRSVVDLERARQSGSGTPSSEAGAMDEERERASLCLCISPWECPFLCV
jgi:hypothetical protein